MTWYKLRSKPGKKEKERGEIEVDIQFMRSSMTASMFDLSVKDKSRSPFGKLKDKLKGKRSSGLSDTASAIIPSTTHSPADSEDESVEKEKKKSKFKTLFSKPGLQKTSLSQSMSVLPTQQPVTERVRLRPSDFQSQWDDEESETSPTSEKAFGNALEEKSSPSPVFKSRKTATLDSRQLNQVTTGHTKKEGLSLFSGLKSKSDPVSKSSLCINGSHVYMEESTTKDNTPASSPSPHNFRRKQLFASEENLSSRSTKGPEETGRTSPSHAFSGSASLETFKSMTLPSYKLLSSEEYPEASVPPTVEVIKETKKTDHKKSALLSLVTGKKEAVKTIDAENIPDRTLQDEENKVPEEKSEQEAKHLELPADLSRGNSSEDGHRAEDVFANKQPLNPFEEERKPEKAAAPAKTKAVKPRLHPVKPMNATANKSQSKNLNVISTMNEKLLEMNVKNWRLLFAEGILSGEECGVPSDSPEKYDPSDPAYAYAQLTHDELIQLVLKQKDTITKKDLQVRELEDYIDNLLVRVMEETPNILRVSMSGNKKAGKM
ncbi:PREDICTED: rab11 family-interacting protein 1 [Pygoscelis adeliae]|uniref:rab11 family-interacting protein 1 n=1 Tax=Pygoscelis adeliae TaxID=9238 RepID=UPI0004F4FE9E|nr:PREDICTED: rab11 family-interacting protein 1 [Pygoscelis adeliae]